ncbi:putative signal transducing protein [Kordia jejudonensis]|uniref:putative signal transducing protein n=1 Tax=Kordia jejudonensis TaxID=1348245 RepID=UPI000629B8E4|nr:DUF2007 domain-containing protein [Kordia jejudonensis]
MSKVKVYESNSQIEAMDAKNILNSADIEFFEINKMDTAYAGILGGSIELHVAPTDSERANELLAKLK